MLKYSSFCVWFRPRLSVCFKNRIISPFSFPSVQFWAFGNIEVRPLVPLVPSCLQMNKATGMAYEKAWDNYRETAGLDMYSLRYYIQHCFFYRPPLRFHIHIRQDLIHTRLDLINMCKLSGNWCECIICVPLSKNKGGPANPAAGKLSGPWPARRYGTFSPSWST